MHQDFGLLILRMSIGCMMLFSHGLPKLMGYSTMMNSFPDPLGVGSALSLGLTIFAEFFCSIAIILGFKTRLATIPLLITMLVALFIIHGNDPWGKKEFVLLYIIPYVTLFMTQGGAYSWDGFRKKK